MRNNKTNFIPATMRSKKSESGIGLRRSFHKRHTGYISITALLTEQLPVAEIARRYGVHRSWIYRLKARYDTDGDRAFQPRSRRPHGTPTATPAATVQLVLRLRRDLTAAGLDAGADTIRWHLQHRHQLTLSRATIYRLLVRHHAVTPDPTKRPRTSYTRFQAEQPNETWQSDFTHWRLHDGTDVEILNWLDDHSRPLLSCTAHAAVSGDDVGEGAGGRLLVARGGMESFAAGGAHAVTRMSATSDPRIAPPRRLTMRLRRLRSRRCRSSAWSSSPRRRAGLHRRSPSAIPITCAGLSAS